MIAGAAPPCLRWCQAVSTWLCMEGVFSCASVAHSPENLQHSGLEWPLEQHLISHTRRDCTARTGCSERNPPISTLSWGVLQDAGKPVDEDVLNSVTMDALADEIRRRGGTPGR